MLMMPDLPGRIPLPALLLAGAFCFCGVAEGAELSLRDTAVDILNESGVQAGQVVHLGCGDGQLTTALGAGDRYLVHGLDPLDPWAAYEGNGVESSKHFPPWTDSSWPLPARRPARL